MTQKQQNRLSMNKAVCDLLYSRQSTWVGMPAFISVADRLKRTIGLMDKALQRQVGNNSTGATLDKGYIGTAAIKKVLLLAHSAAAYAIDKGKTELYTQLSYSRSYIERLNDNELVDALQAMLDKVSLNVAFLGDYNITPARIAEAQAAIDETAIALTRPRTVVDAHSTATSDIVLLEKEMRKLLEMLDKLIINFKEDDAQLVSVYWNARIIVDRGIRHKRPQDGDTQEREETDESIQPAG